MDRPLHCGLRPRALSRYRDTAPVTGGLYIRRKFWLRCGLGSDIRACACNEIRSRSGLKPGVVVRLSCDNQGAATTCREGGPLCWKRDSDLGRAAGA